MTIKDVAMEKSRRCSACEKKMHHGQKAIEIRNDRNKIKAYACSDDCCRKVLYGV